MRALLLFTLFSLTAFGAPLEPYRHNFFTTNPSPVVEVVAGTNTSVQYSTAGTDTRRYTVNSLGITNGQAGVVLDGLQLYSSSGNAVITNNSGVMQFDSGTGTKATYADGDWLVTELFATNGITSYGDITLSGTISGDGSGLTNLAASAISGVLTQGMASFSDFALSGTNVVISPTNGNLQSWVITEQSWAALDAADTNYTETIRLNVYGSNTVTWTSANLSNTASLGPSNSISVMLFDHSRGTNLWWGMRIR
jgi:hypothetical protein